MRAYSSENTTRKVSSAPDVREPTPAERIIPESTYH